MHIKKVRPLNIWASSGPTLSVPGNTTNIYEVDSPSIPVPSGDGQTLHIWNVLANIEQDSANLLEVVSGIYVGVNLWEDEAQATWLASLFLASYGPPTKFAAAAGSAGLLLDPSGSVSIGASSSGDVPLVEIPDMIVMAGNALGGAGYPRFASVYCTAAFKNLTANPHNVNSTITVAWSLES